MWKRNSLTIVMATLFLVSWAGNAVAGFLHETEERKEHGAAPPGFGEYLASGDFWESTAENWESEFLQMASFVWLTVFLRQRGSSQSRPEKGETDSDREPKPRPGAPWPVQRGGVVLKVYEHSLSLSLFGLFLFSFALHAVAGRSSYNEEQALHGQPAVSVLGYVASSRFWFESLQNWQSEFLAVAVLVVLSIFLRERGSPESKPVDAAHAETEA